MAVDGVKDGAVQLTLKSPNHGLVPNTVLFAFDQGNLEEGGRYRGEFKVSTSAENSPAIQMVPNLPLSDGPVQGIGYGQGALDLVHHDADRRRGLFAGMDEATRQALVPKDQLAEYAKADRPLRDYELFFHENFVQRSLLADGIAKLNEQYRTDRSGREGSDTRDRYRQTRAEPTCRRIWRSSSTSRRRLPAYAQTLAKQYDQLRAVAESHVRLGSQSGHGSYRRSACGPADEIDQRSAAAPGAQRLSHRAAVGPGAAGSGVPWQPLSARGVERYSCTRMTSGHAGA